MIERKTVLDKVEVYKGGDLGVRIGLLLVENGTELSANWHRTTIPADVVVADHFVIINQHLANRNWPVIGPVIISKISQIAAIVRGN